MRININNRNQIKSLDNKLTLISYLISNGITIPPFEKQGTFINTEGFIKRTTNSFINFQYYATQTLTNLNFYLGTKNQKFSIYKKFNIFKRSRVKFFNIQLSYWLNDFYTGGKESFCQNSLSLVRCSSNHKLQLTNFFSIGFSNLQNSTFFFPTEFNYLNSIAMVFVICCIFFAGTGARRGLLRNFVSNIRNKITQLKNLYFLNSGNSSNKHRGAP